MSEFQPGSAWRDSLDHFTFEQAWDWASIEMIEHAALEMPTVEEAVQYLPLEVCDALVRAGRSNDGFKVTRAQADQCFRFGLVGARELHLNSFGHAVRRALLASGDFA